MSDRSCLCPIGSRSAARTTGGRADELRANSKLKSSEFSVPVLGLIFLRYADHKFAQAKEKFASQGSFDPEHPHWDYHVHRASAKMIEAGLRPERTATVNRDLLRIAADGRTRERCPATAPVAFPESLAPF